MILTHANAKRIVEEAGASNTDMGILLMNAAEMLEQALERTKRQAKYIEDEAGRILVGLNGKNSCLWVNSCGVLQNAYAINVAVGELNMAKEMLRLVIHQANKHPALKGRLTDYTNA